MTDIDIQVSLTDRDKDNRQYGGSRDSITTTGNASQSILKEIGTGEETVAFDAEITGGSGPGYCYIKNHGTDAADYVEIGNATGDYWLKLFAGQEALIPLHDANCDTLYLKATDGPMEVEVYCQER